MRNRSARLRCTISVSHSLRVAIQRTQSAHWSRQVHLVRLMPRHGSGRSTSRWVRTPKKHWSHSRVHWLSTGSAAQLVHTLGLRRLPRALATLRVPPMNGRWRFAPHPVMPPLQADLWPRVCLAVLTTTMTAAVGLCARVTTFGCSSYERMSYKILSQAIRCM